MANKLREMTAPRLVLEPETAAELMRPNPVSIRADASVGEAVALLSDKGFSAAPVIDEGGRPVGVVSRSDILVHDRERTDYVPAVADYYQDEKIRIGSGEFSRAGFQVVDVDRACVRDIMTPVVFAVSPRTAKREYRFFSFAYGWPSGGAVPAADCSGSCWAGVCALEEAPCGCVFWSSDIG